MWVESLAVESHCAVTAVDAVPTQVIVPTPPLVRTGSAYVHIDMQSDLSRDVPFKSCCGGDCVAQRHFMHCKSLNTSVWDTNACVLTNGHGSCGANDRDPAATAEWIWPLNANGMCHSGMWNP